MRSCQLIQDLDKKEAAADKQRESMMVGLSKTKTELGSLQDTLARTQLDLEKTNFELHAKTSMFPPFTMTASLTTQPDQCQQQPHSSACKAAQNKPICAFVKASECKCTKLLCSCKFSLCLTCTAHCITTSSR